MCPLYPQLQSTCHYTVNHYIKISRVEVFGQIFVRNAMNEVNFCKKCDDCGECCENKYFTAFYHISYKNSPHFLQKFTALSFAAISFKKCGESGEWGEKNNSPHFTTFLTKIHRIFFPTFAQSDLNSQEISGKLVTVGAEDYAVENMQELRGSNLSWDASFL